MFAPALLSPAVFAPAIFSPGSGETERAKASGGGGGPILRRGGDRVFPPGELGQAPEVMISQAPVDQPLAALDDDVALMLILLALLE